MRCILLFLLTIYYAFPVQAGWDSFTDKLKNTIEQETQGAVNALENNVIYRTKQAVQESVTPQPEAQTQQADLKPTAGQVEDKEEDKVSTADAMQDIAPAAAGGAGSFSGFELDGVAPSMNKAQIEYALLSHGYVKTATAPTGDGIPGPARQQAIARGDVFERVSTVNRHRKDTVSVKQMSGGPRVTWERYLPLQGSCFELVDGKANRCTEQEMKGAYYAEAPRKCVWQDDADDFAVEVESHGVRKRKTKLNQPATKKCTLKLSHSGG